MSQLQSILLVLHVLFGAAALIIFWVPFFTEKGRLNHIKFGTYYTTSMYAMAFCGSLMAVFIFLMPQVMRPELFSGDRDPVVMSQYVRAFATFIFFLGVLSYATTRNAIAVLRAKDDKSSLRTVGYLSPLVVLLISGPILFWLGMRFGEVLHYIFAVLNTLVAIGMLRYCLRDNKNQRAWILEHVGTIIGSGIGAYTAFVAFGGRTLFADLGQWQLVFWVAPGLIGSIASYILCKRYALFYRVTPMAQSSK